MELVGWIGAIFFAICAFPQAYKCWKQKHAYGLSNLTLFFWTAGELLTFIYVVVQLQLFESLPLIFNYIANLLSLIVIIYYKFFPKTDNRGQNGRSYHERSLRHSG